MSLTDAQVAEIAGMTTGTSLGGRARDLAREVLAARNLIADVRAWHAPDSAHDEDGRRPRCRACNEVCPCPTVRVLDAAEGRA